MMRNGFTCLCVLALAFAAAPPATAQAVRGELRGGDAGHVLPGAWLHLLSESGVAVDSAQTDPGGRFELSAREAGDYVLFFQMDGWASIPSDPLRLEAAATTSFDFHVPLVPTAALRQMGDMIRSNEHMQTALPDLCGEELRPWEAGMLVGVVRSRATRAPIAGARVSVTAEGSGAVRSTLSAARGVYILCNVPLGSAVHITAETPDGVTETSDVEIRAGTVSWYDLMLGPRRP